LVQMKLLFTVGLGMSYLVYKKIGNPKVKYGILAIIALLIILVGNAWTAASNNLGIPNQEYNPKEEIDFNDSQATKPSISIENVSQTPTLEPQSISANSNLVLARVVRIIDGDTIEVDLGKGNKKTVRYLGIDTPETVDPNKDAQCFGKEATARNKELVGNGIVGLKKDVSETDRYGRLLRYIYMGDLFINQILASEGYAHAYSYPPDIKYQDELRQAEQQARESGKGLWGNACSSQAAQPAAGTYACDCSKSCLQISSCAEAQYQLNICGCSARDGDKDGIACDGAPLVCQQ
jgi:micrococcal nuclease